MRFFTHQENLKALPSPPEPNLTVGEKVLDETDGIIVRLEKYLEDLIKKEQDVLDRASIYRSEIDVVNEMLKSLVPAKKGLMVIVDKKLDEDIKERNSDGSANEDNREGDEEG